MLLREKRIIIIVIIVVVNVITIIVSRAIIIVVVIINSWICCLCRYFLCKEKITFWGGKSSIISFPTCKAFILIINRDGIWEKSE